MNYQGQGLLIGYKTYKKDNVDKHIYYVLNGNKDSKSGLYSECEFITIIQDEQTLKELKPQQVNFEVSSQSFGGQVRNRYINIRSISEV